jgi:hypothetical protein
VAGQDCAITVFFLQKRYFFFQQFHFNNDFQKDAVLGLINKLERYNGAILADSVGLGKTFRRHDKRRLSPLP